MKTEMTLPDGRTFQGKGMAGFIEVSLAQLVSYRGTSPNPERLEWEIRVYQFILSQPDPEMAADQYFSARKTDNGPPLSKREAVRRLGWTIV